MPVSYSFSGSLIRMDLAGICPMTEIRETLTDAMADPAFPAGGVALIDLRHSESLATRSSEEILAISEFASPKMAARCRRCALVVETELQFGIMRMGEVFAERHQLDTMVFYDIPSALEWLGLSEKDN